MMIDSDGGQIWMHVWAIATAATVAAACALVGSFLVVRRLSLLGQTLWPALRTLR
jgi:ABC-type Mn2+/Zn2+ transport system permease subunit